MSTVTAVRSRLSPVTVLAVGDVVVLGAVLTAGVVSHGQNPVGAPVEFAETVVPFLLGWGLLAGILGLYESPRLDPVGSVRMALGAWVGAANVGLILRGSPFLAGGLTWPFPLVITGFGGVAVVAWRLLATRLTGGDGDETADQS